MDRTLTTESGEAEEILPIESFKEEIVSCIRRNDIIICIGETGSGKTTKVPQFCLTEGLSGSGIVGVTQPRRVAAITVAQRVSEERGVLVGDEVGYTVRFDDSTSSKTRIKYMTDGILVRECLEDKALSRYTVIMLDEAHERSMHTDILFALVKEAAHLRMGGLKVIITSATLDFERFSLYFNQCPVIRIPGRVYPVDIFHSKMKQCMTASGPSNNSYVESAADIVRKIHRRDEEGHILVFLTGQDEIEKCAAMLRTSLEEEEHGNPVNENPRSMVILPLYASLPSEAQRAVFQKGAPSDNSASSTAGKPVRKCIIATNIAETSVTVPNVRFVVDAGYVKQKTYNPERRIETLVVVPISQVAAAQRAGRAGRTASGQCYRLYSSECYSNMMAETVPEILRMNLANAMLYLKVLGIEDVFAFDFIEKPGSSQIAEALVQLHLLGALDDTGKVTERGRRMSMLPLEPTVSRMIIEAASSECDCLSEMVDIAAMLSTENFWVTSSRTGPASRSVAAFDANKLNQERAHTNLQHPLGDHLTYLQVLRQFENCGSGHRNENDEQWNWCSRNFLRLRALRSAVKIRNQLLGDIKKIGLGKNVRAARVPLSARVEAAVCRAVTAGLFMNAARRCGTESMFKSVPLPMPSFNVDAATTTASSAAGRGRDAQQEVVLLHLHQQSALVAPAAPSSAAMTKNPPEFVVYQELVFGGRVSMRHVLGVDPLCLRAYRTAYRAADPLVLSNRLPILSAETNHDSADRHPGKVAANETTTIASNAVAQDSLKRARIDDLGDAHEQARSAAKERYLARKRA